MNVFYEQHFKGLLVLFDIEDQEGCEVQLNQKIKELMNSNIRLEDELKKQTQRIDIMEGDIKLNDSEHAKKDKIIEELGKHVAKLEANVAVAIQKLIKYEVLIEDCNRQIVENELVAACSRLETLGGK